MLRQRCDARGFTLLPIENIARRKVAPAFVPMVATRDATGAFLDGSKVTGSVPQLVPAKLFRLVTSTMQRRARRSIAASACAPLSARCSSC